MSTPYRLHEPTPGEFVLTHAGIPEARMRMKITAQTTTERMVLERVLVMLNCRNGTPQSELAAVTEGESV